VSTAAALVILLHGVGSDDAAMMPLAGSRAGDRFPRVRREGWYCEVMCLA